MAPAAATMRALLALVLAVPLAAAWGCAERQAPDEQDAAESAPAVHAAGASERTVGARSLRHVGKPMSIPKVDDRPNVLLISFDNVRADRMSSYGAPRPTTPNLDALAARGTRFADCTAQAPFTPHSYSSLFSSLFVAELPVRERARTDQEPVVRAGLEEYHVTLPEVLQDAGYHTAAFVRGWFTPAFGLTQGFDRVVYRGQPLSRTVRDAVRWLRAWKAQAADRPFFLFAYGVDVHYRFMDQRPADSHVFGGDPSGYNIDRDALRRYNDGEQKPGPRDLENALTLYDEGLYWADHDIKPLLDELAALGIDDETIVVFASDHGEEFTEHGYLSHGQSNFRTVVDVPLIIHDPRVRGGVTVEEPVMNVDLMPTILELCRIPVPETVSGTSLANLVRGSGLPTLDQRYVFSEGAWNGFLGLARAGRWSFLMDNKRTPYLFDRRTDPNEQRNLAERLPALARHMEQVLFAHKRAGLATQLVELHGLALKLDRMGLPVLDPSQLGLARPTEAPQLDEESIEQLRALGYLQ